MKRVSRKGQRSSCAPLSCLLPGRIKAVGGAAGLVVETLELFYFETGILWRDKKLRESSGDFLVGFRVTMLLVVGLDEDVGAERLQPGGNSQAGSLEEAPPICRRRQLHGLLG